MRANASRASEELVEVAEEAGVYWERLDDYEEEGLEELERRTGKRRKKRTKQIKRDNRRTHKRVSRTDPESGHLKRPGKPEGPHYLAHQAVDSDYGIIVGQTVTAGDVNDFRCVLADRAYSRKCCTNSGCHGGRRLRFPAGPSGAGRAGDRLLCTAAEDRRAGKHTVYAGRFLPRREP